jgi:hypothetical protein
MATFVELTGIGVIAGLLVVCGMRHELTIRQMIFMGIGNTVIAAPLAAYGYVWARSNMDSLLIWGLLLLLVGVGTLTGALILRRECECSPDGKTEPASANTMPSSVGYGRCHSQDSLGRPKHNPAVTTCSKRGNSTKKKTL